MDEPQYYLAVQRQALCGSRDEHPIIPNANNRMPAMAGPAQEHAGIQRYGGSYAGSSDANQDGFTAQLPMIPIDNDNESYDLHHYQHQYEHAIGFQPDVTTVNEWYSMLTYTGYIDDAYRPGLPYPFKRRDRSRHADRIYSYPDTQLTATHGNSPLYSEQIATDASHAALAAMLHSVKAQNHRRQSLLQCWEHGCNGRQFASSSNLRRHQREMATCTTTTACLWCNRLFKRKESRDRHVKRRICRMKGGRARRRA